MNKEETMAIKPPPPKNLCPICGTPSYSVGGVHPQCAIQQADEPRLKRLRATRATESTAKKPLPGKWKKRCPICGTEAHVRRQACRCGHKFEKR